MRNGIIALAVFAAAITAIAENAPQDLTASTVPPTVVTDFRISTAYVIGLDGKIRTCLPEVYSLLVRPEGGSKTDFNFYYVPPGQKLFSTKQQHYTVACVIVKGQGK